MEGNHNQIFVAVFPSASQDMQLSCNIRSNLVGFYEMSGQTFGAESKSHSSQMKGLPLHLGIAERTSSKAGGCLDLRAPRLSSPSSTASSAWRSISRGEGDRRTGTAHPAPSLHSSPTPPRQLGRGILAEGEQLLGKAPGSLALPLSPTAAERAAPRPCPPCAHPRVASRHAERDNRAGRGVIVAGRCPGAAQDMSRPYPPGEGTRWVGAQPSGDSEGQEPAPPRSPAPGLPPRLHGCHPAPG